MKRLLPTLILGLLAFTGCETEKSRQQAKELEELRALADMDRREMENQYEQFALQYDELKKGIQDDSLIAHLEAERQRTEQLLAELRQMHKSDAAEIRRLKKELETVRAILRTYVIQVDSLTRENGRLTTERDEARALLGDAKTEIHSLSDERARLNDKVARAAQLDATNIVIATLKGTGKATSKAKDIKRFDVSFTIARNVTAATGERRVYLRLMGPSGTVIGRSGSFAYENKQIEYSATRTFEYTGEEQRLTLTVPANDVYVKGKYSAHLFCDDQMIGTASLNIEK